MDSSGFKVNFVTYYIYLKMKKITKQFLAVFALFFALTLTAQDEDNPWIVSFGVNAIDTYPTNAPTNDVTGVQGKWFQEFFNVSHWNITSLSSVSVGRSITERFSLIGQLNMNRLNVYGDNKAGGVNLSTVDLGLRRQLTAKGSTLTPYYQIGAGYSSLDGEASVTYNFGFGLGYWVNDKLGFSYESKYKNAVDDNGINHFQHTFGVNLKFGGVDTDGDGVYDKFDACPEEPGLEEFSGCPDTDGDGIADKDDACPTAAGSVAMNGCPDTDGDGIADPDDACPNRAGTSQMGGCPDSDGDGLNDKDDACPQVAGPAQNNGCPWPDTDGDGVADKDDACPQLAGVAANNGCPELPEDVIATLNNESSMIRFKAESNKIVGEESTVVLGKIKGILDSYPTVSFVIEGHASSDGSKGYNQKLSESRAASVMAALIEAGSDQSRLTSVAYGEDRPIGDNNTAKGRKSNRRVQFSLGSK